MSGMRDVITCRYHGFENGVVVRIPDYLVIDVGFATVNFNASLGMRGIISGARGLLKKGRPRAS